jgi:iron complex outermembrane receptor protein
MKIVRLIAALAAAAALAARAQEPPAEGDSPLDELLASPISTAAKYAQNMDEVAASVTVITAEEIARYGWRSLAEVLTAVRSVYTTSDRGYTYLGVRGIGLPTDYNNRFLILLDGHPVVEAVSGSIDVGTGLGIDITTIDRIEFVRGPGSVLYGTGAMFGVINLITKDERERPSMEVAAGSGDLWTGTARAGAVFGEIKTSAAVSWREHGGGNHYFAEFDDPGTNNGVVKDRDYDDYRNVLLTARWRDLRLVSVHSTRTKGVPTASWDTDFGGNEHITDGRTLWALSYSAAPGVGKQLFARAFYDRFHYVGNYPYGDFNYSDRADSSRVGAELRYVWDIRKHRLTGGAEYVANHGKYAWNRNDGGTPFIESDHGYLGAYAQVESRLSSRFSTTIGLGYDAREGVRSQFTPRGALIFQAAPGSVMKLLYGQAFRTPSMYELDYSNDDFLPSSAGAESIRTTELVLEQRVSESVLATVSVFDVHVDDLIRLHAENDTFQFRNVASAESHGAELQLDYRRNDGIWSYVSYSQQIAEEGDETMRNSPRHLFKTGLSTATANRFYGAIEARYESGRRTNSGSKTDSAIVTNLHFGWRVLPATTVTFGIRNALDADYATPGGAEHRQDAIQQDGRTFIVGIKVGGR